MSSLTKDLKRFLFEREIEDIDWDELDLEQEIIWLGLLIAENDRMLRAKVGLLDSKWKLIRDLEAKQQEIVNEAVSHKTPNELKQIKNRFDARAAEYRKSVAPPPKINNSAFYFGNSNNNAESADSANNINVRNIIWSNKSKPTRAKRRFRIRNVTRRIRQKPKYPVHR
jgi:hypothetical protein